MEHFPDNIISQKPQLGSKSKRIRSDMAKNILALEGMLPEAIYEQLKAFMPSLQREMSIEEMMTLVLSAKAIFNGDVSAYNAIMDSSYGRATQEMKIKTESISTLKMPDLIPKSNKKLDITKHQENE